MMFVVCILCIGVHTFVNSLLNALSSQLCYSYFHLYIVFLSIYYPEENDLKGLQIIRRHFTSCILATIEIYSYISFA